ETGGARLAAAPGAAPDPRRIRWFGLACVFPRGLASPAAGERDRSRRRPTAHRSGPTARLNQRLPWTGRPLRPCRGVTRPKARPATELRSFGGCNFTLELPQLVNDGGVL